METLLDDDSDESSYIEDFAGRPDGGSEVQVGAHRKKKFCKAQVNVLQS